MTFWVAGAVAVAGIAGAVASSSAAGTQAAAQQQAANTQQGMFNTLVQQQQPYIQGGYGAETSLTQLLGTSAATGPGGTAAGTDLPGGYLTQTFNPTQQQLENYPGYQFQLQQGDMAVTNADTPGVGALSGANLKSLMGFNQGLAASNYNQYFNQFQTQQNNIFDRLSGIAQLGQAGAANLAAPGAQLGTGIAQAQAAAGASQAAGTVGVANSIGGSAIPLAYMLGGSSGAGSIAGANGEISGLGLSGTGAGYTG